jgi:hypothetical protein
MVSDSILKEQAEKYYDQMFKLMTNAGFPGLDKDDIVELLVIFYEDIRKKELNSVFNE